MSYYLVKAYDSRGVRVSEMWSKVRERGRSLKCAEELITELETLFPEYVYDWSPVTDAEVDRICGCVYRYIGPEKSKKPLAIDDKKALWLMRMCLGEGGKECSYAKAVTLCWAIINRWFLWPGARLFPTFVFFMRRFSQPINPRWMTGGDLARKYIGKDPASPARLRRRARICKMQSFPDVIVRAVHDMQYGMCAQPKPTCKVVLLRTMKHSPENYYVTNWAALPSSPKKWPHGYDVDGDWFFQDDNVKPGRVMVDFET